MEYFLLIVYFAILTYITILGIDKEKSDDSYFYNHRQTSWKSSLISIFATETSVATILIFPAVGYEKNGSIIFLGLGYIVGRYLVSWFYLPHIHQLPSLSLYEGITTPKGKYVLSSAFLIAKYISGSVRFFLAGYAVSQITQLPIVWNLILMGFFVGIYSLSGGLRSVILTDQFQGGIMILFGILVLLLFSFDGSFFVRLDELNFSLSRSLFLFFGGILLTLSSHGADQDILQRVLSVRKLDEAKRSLFTSGWVVFFVILIFFLIGYEISHEGEFDKKSPLLSYVLSIPHDLLLSLVLKNLFLVFVFAAAMSTLDSTIHSTGAIWKSLLRKFPWNFKNYFYSLISLVVMFSFSLVYIFYKKNQDFLSFALGMMNYVNGVLFTTTTLYILFRKPLSSKVIVLSIATNVTTTLICEFFELYFALTTIISFLTTFIVSTIGFLILELIKKTKIQTKI
ncbi:MAG: hypothetical protein NZ853_03340 [Leptospiraceae bacterium]|nr:hypothetical protein [Leptospiraceae bacterium]MDW7975208.1 hypothetical protein [Leptospiraceae bacterium]